MDSFLKDLPCRNAENFTKINPDTCHRYLLNSIKKMKILYFRCKIIKLLLTISIFTRSTTSKRTTYIPVKDIPADQVIVTEKTNILLRYFLFSIFPNLKRNKAKINNAIANRILRKMLLCSSEYHFYSDNAIIFTSS